jgi:hypothetical protein
MKSLQPRLKSQLYLAAARGDVRGLERASDATVELTLAAAATDKHVGSLIPGRPASREAANGNERCAPSKSESSSFPRWRSATERSGAEPCHSADMPGLSEGWHRRDGRRIRGRLVVCVPCLRSPVGSAAKRGAVASFHGISTIGDDLVDEQHHLVSVNDAGCGFL